MEYLLYGGTLGANTNCPSLANGYMASNGYCNSAFQYPYYGMSEYNTLTNPSFAANTSAAPAAGSQSGSGTLSSAWDVLGDYYIKSSSPSESLAGAAAGGLAFAVLMRPHLVAHPLNALSRVGAAEKMFLDVRKEGTELYKLWKNPDTHKIMSDAYGRTHRFMTASKSKIGLFKKRIDPNSEVYKNLIKEMEDALKSGDKVKIAEATEKMRAVMKTKTGYFYQGWRKIKGALGFNSAAPTMEGALADTQAIKSAAAKNIAESSSKSLTKTLTHGLKGQAGLGGVFFVGLEFLCDAGKIKTAFEKDSSTGWTHVGQTTVKGLGSLVGWTVGEAAGAWAGAKLGALAGSAICPGLGTAIGAVAGLVGGSIGCALMGKLTHKIVGTDAGTKVEAAKLKSTSDGQAQLLQLTLQQAQEDKNLDPKVLQALQNIAASAA